MLPTNSGRAKDQGCNPVSSNCVVWQGPDLDCIGLCKGDTISDVVQKLATDLCTVMDAVDLTNLDLTCLSIPNSEEPDDFSEFIQILIDRICALEGITPVNPTDPTDCPDNCIVSIADCFQYIDGQGDTVIAMTLVEYVTAIGNRICDIIDDITALQDAVNTLQVDQAATAARVTVVEDDKADIDSLNYQVNTKTSASAGIQYITEALRYVENFMLGQSDATGSITAWYENILKAGLISDENRMFGSGLMSSINGWTTNVLTAAESLGNAWLAIRDLRSEVDYIKENCCSSGCSDIWLNFRSTLTVNTLTIFADGSTGFTADWRECTGDTRITVTDELGNTSTFTTSLLAILDTPSGYSIDLSATTIDISTNLTVVADTCFINTTTDTTCNEDYTDIIINSASCPATVLTIYSTAINYQFNSTSGFTYIANVYYQGGSTPVASQIIATPGVIVLNSISGLLTETDYEFELIVVDTVGDQTPCPKQSFTTLADDCQAPTNAVAILTT